MKGDANLERSDPRLDALASKVHHFEKACEVNRYVVSLHG